MGIERGQATGASATVTQRPGTGKNPAQAAASGDFLALLAALDAMLPAGGEPGLTGEGTPDGAAPHPEALDPLNAQRADPAAPLPAEAAAALAAAEAAAAAAAAAQHAAPAPAAPPTPPAARAADAAVQPLATADAAAQQADAAVDPAARQPATAAAAADQAAPAPLPPQLASVFEQLKSRLAAREAAATESADAAAAAKAGIAATAQAAQRDARGERGFNAPMSQAAWARAEPVAVQGQAFDRQPARSAPRGEEAATGARAEPGAWAPQDFTPTVQYDAATAGIDATPQPAAPDEPLAEQLRYWVSQGLRSAELTVQGDADPVQVSISMQGNEAHVSFRSEQAATREMLAGSTDQLRELLQAQGMVLSGVSVGAHDAGGRGGQPQDAQARTRPGAPRVGGVEATTPGASGVGGAAAAAARTAAGGLDLYV